MNNSGNSSSLRTPNSRTSNVLSAIWSKVSKKSEADVSICRICHDEEGTLISPCLCSGSVGRVHQLCLEKWLTVAHGDTCELCGHGFDVRKTNPPPLGSWILNMTDVIPTAVGDIVCFILLTPMAFVAVYLCILGASYYFKIQRNDAIGLIVLASFLILIYVLWILLTFRYYRKKWLKWQSVNQTVELVDIAVLSSE